MADYLNCMSVRLIDEIDMENAHDWLSRLLEIIPVRRTLDYRCFLGAPWRIDVTASELGEIPYHVIRGGSPVLEDLEGGDAQADRRRHSSVSRRISQRSILSCPPPRAMNAAISERWADAMLTPSIATSWIL